MTSRNLISTRRFRASALAGLAAAALALSGCNPGGEPSTSGTTTPSGPESAIHSQTASPTPTPSAAYKPADASGRAQNVPVPVLPEVAKTETKEGLEAFTRYWFATLSYAYETGDIKPMEAISASSCTFCRGLSENIGAAWADSKWVVGGQIETPAVTAIMSVGTPSHATVQVLQQTVTIHNADGSPYQEPTKATNSGSQATASFGQAGWVLDELGLIR